MCSGGHPDLDSRGAERSRGHVCEGDLVIKAWKKCAFVCVCYGIRMLIIDLHSNVEEDCDQICKKVCMAECFNVYIKDLLRWELAHVCENVSFNGTNRV